MEERVQVDRRSLPTAKLIDLIYEQREEEPRQELPPLKLKVCFIDALLVKVGDDPTISRTS